MACTVECSLVHGLLSFLSASSPKGNSAGVEIVQLTLGSNTKPPTLNPTVGCCLVYVFYDLLSANVLRS